MIRITSMKHGFRRAGMEHSGTAEYPDLYFSEEQLAALKAEPLLVVEIVPGDNAQEKDGDAETVSDDGGQKDDTGTESDSNEAKPGKSGKAK